MFLCIPLTFLLVQELTNFQTFLDENGAAAVAGNLNQESRTKMINYIYNEMLLFGVGSIVSTVLFAFRMIISIWRVHNDHKD